MCVTSLNAKGLNVPEKRRMFLNDLKQIRTDVAFVQETHFKGSGLPFIQNRFFPCVYHASNQEAKSKGLSILISSRVPWSLITRCFDTDGRYPFLKGHISGIKVMLATIYAPNIHQDFFFSKVYLKLTEFTESKLILGGGILIFLYIPG